MITQYHSLEVPDVGDDGTIYPAKFDQTLYDVDKLLSTVFTTKTNSCVLTGSEDCVIAAANGGDITIQLLAWNLSYIAATGLSRSVKIVRPVTDSGTVTVYSPDADITGSDSLRLLPGDAVTIIAIPNNHRVVI